MRIRSRRPTLAEANRQGQQLFLANMDRSVGGRCYPKKGSEPPAVTEIRPVSHRQLVLIEVPIDLEAGRQRGFLPPKDPLMAAGLRIFIGEHAAGHGWSTPITEGVQRGVRILLGTQDTPGAQIRASEVMLLSRLGISARAALEVLSACGMLEEDRVPAVVRWFGLQISAFPDEMRRELEVWFEVMRQGSVTPPRYRPRSDKTTTSQFHFALPALRAWAKAHQSLREIARDDVHAALPPSGGPRSTMLQGLRSIFRVLKARQLVFVNPTARMSVPAPNRATPPGVDLVALREALDSSDVVRAALAGLLAFHAVRVWQLCQLQLTDLHDGRLYVGDQVILLADPTRERLGAYLDDRVARWPNTANTHLFIHHRNANATTAVTPWWIRKRLGMSAQTIRQDRILDEAHATGGDIRQICDLFGLSVAGAYRYTATVDRLSRDLGTGATASALIESGQRDLSAY